MGRLSTVDLLVLTSLDQLLFILKFYLLFLQKRANVNEEVNCTEPSPQLVFPAKSFIFGTYKLMITTLSIIMRKHNFQHNITQHNDIQCLYQVSLCWVVAIKSFILSVVMLNVVAQNKTIIYWCYKSLFSLSLTRDKKLDSLSFGKFIQSCLILLTKVRAYPSGVTYGPSISQKISD